MEALMVGVYLAVGFSPFITLNILCYLVLTCRDSAKKSTDGFLGVPYTQLVDFSLDAFDILSLSLIFATLITMRLHAGLFGLILLGLLCASWAWKSVTFPKLGKFSAICFLPLSLSLSSFWNPYPVTVSKHDVYESGTTWCSSRDLVNCSHLFLFLFSVNLRDFHYCLLAHWSVPLYHLINYQFLLVYFFISVFGSLYWVVQKIPSVFK